MSNRMLTGSVLIFATLLGFVAMAETVYKKVNTDGSIEYSDQPFNGAKPFEIIKNTQTGLPQLVDKKIASVQSKSLSKAPGYAISIQSPSPQQIIRSNNGELSVMVQTTPQLTSKLKVQLFINGIPYRQPTQHTVFKLKNINRGEVKIKAQLIDNHGKILASSSEATVYLHRAVARRAN